MSYPKFMNSVTEQTKAINRLLTYPQQAATILTVHAHLIDRKLIERMEQLSSYMHANGSQKTATFLASLVTPLNKLINTKDITTLEPKEIEAFILASQINDEASTKQETKPQSSSVFLPLKDPKVISTEIDDWEQDHPQAIAQAPGKNRFKLFSSAALVISLLLLVLNSQSKNKLLNLPQVLATNSSDNAVNKSISGNILPVETIILQPVNSYQVSRSYSGQIVANRNSDLSFALSGKLIALKVKEGDVVEPGTPLAYLNTDNLQANKQELLARKAQAVAQLKELQAGARPETIAAAKAVVTDFQEQILLESQRRLRREKLHAEGAISREQLDEILTSESSLQARLDEAQSRLDELEAGTRPEQVEAQQAVIQELDANIANIDIELNKSVLKAPFAGTISNRQVDEGTVVSSGQPIFRLVENHILEAHIGIPINQSEQIKLGETFPLTVEQGTYPAKVTSLLPELDANTRSLMAVFTLEPSASKKIFPGQIARLQLTQSVPNSGFWLPTTALVRGDRGLWYCYVLGKTPSDHDNTNTESIFQIERRAVEVLHSNSNQALVRGTLQSGEKVIANGINRLVPGQLVTLK